MLDKYTANQLPKWSLAVREKAGFRCERCGREHGKTYNTRLEAHHVLPATEYPDYILNPNNGVCLCHRCHSLMHTEMLALTYEKSKYEHPFKSDIEQLLIEFVENGNHEDLLVTVLVT